VYHRHCHGIIVYIIITIIIIVVAIIIIIIVVVVIVIIVVFPFLILPFPLALHIICNLTSLFSFLYFFLPDTSILVAVLHALKRYSISYGLPTAHYFIKHGVSCLVAGPSAVLRVTADEP
jgi:hypothetical protein